jgi:hypothetical protein
VSGLTPAGNPSITNEENHEASNHPCRPRAVRLGAAIAPVAQASSINECGALVMDGVQNITTRNVACSDACSFADKISYQSPRYSGSVTLPGWHTYAIHYHYNGWQVDVRATRTNHVIHFQIGPYGVSDGGSGGKCGGIPAGQPCY